MGIIQKQAIKGTVYSYLGVLIGFVTTGILFPRVLDTNEIGLIKLLVSFSVLFAQVGSLGFNNVINRLFPYFRQKSTVHNGFISLAMLVSLLGFMIILAGFELYKPVLIRNNIDNSTLLIEYINYIIPLIFSFLFFSLFDAYNKVLYDTVLGAFLKEFLQRVLILVGVLLYYFNVLNLHEFIIAYIIAFIIPTLILFVVLLHRGELTLKIRKTAFRKDIVREIISLSIFGIVSGLGSLTIIHIDTILVNRFLGLSATGIYAIAFFFGTLVLIPSRTLIKISTAVIAEAWKKNDLENIDLIYKKSSINQGVISMLVFIGIWVNIDNVFEIITKDFESGKWVIFFIGLSNVINMSSGVNGTIISTSRHYRVNTYFILLFLLTLVGLNVLLIPKLGLTGAALATFIAQVIFNFMRYLFVRIKYGMEPFNYKILILVLISFAAYFAGHLLPEFSSYIIDILVRSSIVLAVFSVLVLQLKISEDVSDLFEVVKTYFRKRS